MKKIAICFIFSALFLMLFSTSAFAADNNTDEAYKMVEKTNAKIEKEIEKAELKGDMVLSDTEKEEKIAGKLYDKTEKMVAKLADKVEDDGFTVEKVYIDVEIGTTTISIDPCHVIGP